jgi:hypothetical protein
VERACTGVRALQIAKLCNKARSRLHAHSIIFAPVCLNASLAASVWAQDNTPAADWPVQVNYSCVPVAFEKNADGFGERFLARARAMPWLALSCRGKWTTSLATIRATGELASDVQACHVPTRVGPASIPKQFA